MFLCHLYGRYRLFVAATVPGLPSLANMFMCLLKVNTLMIVLPHLNPFDNVVELIILFVSFRIWVIKTSSPPTALAATFLKLNLLWT